MVIDIWSFLLLLGLIQGAFLFSVLVFQKKGNRKANRFLAALIGIISIQLFTYLLVTTGLYKYVPHFINAGIPFVFLIGPLYYFYVKCLLERACEFRARDLAHALPVIPAVIYYWPYYMHSAEYKIQLVEYMESQTVVEVPAQTIIFIGLHALQTGIYIWLALRMLKRYHTKAEEPLINGRRLKFKWLKQFSAAFLSYWVLLFLSFVLLDFFDSVAPEIDYVVFLSMSLIVHVVGYVGIKESGIFSESIRRSTIKKYQSSPLSSEEARQLVIRLKMLMENDRLYLQNDLSLTELADKLSISSNYLSQIINQELDCSFYDFINRYRVKEAKRRLKSPSSKSLTILAIAYEVGFNNKNSFNKAFKKFTGTTPSAFMKNYSVQST